VRGCSRMRQVFNRGDTARVQSVLQRHRYSDHTKEERKGKERFKCLAWGAETCRTRYRKTRQVLELTTP